MDFGSESAPQNPHGHPDQWQHCSSRWARNLGSWGFFVGSLDILDVDFGKPCDFIMDQKRFPKIIQSYGLDFFNLVFFWDDFINPKIIQSCGLEKHSFLELMWILKKGKKKTWEVDDFLGLFSGKLWV